MTVTNMKLISNEENDIISTYTGESGVQDTKHCRALGEIRWDGRKEALEWLAICHALLTLRIERAGVKYLAELLCCVFARRLVAMVDKNRTPISVDASIESCVMLSAMLVPIQSGGKMTYTPLNHNFRASPRGDVLACSRREDGDTLCESGGSESEGGQNKFHCIVEVEFEGGGLKCADPLICLWKSVRIWILRRMLYNI